MRPNRRIVVAMIYWEEMANNVNDQDWYEQKIKQAIKVGFPSGKSRSFRASKNLPNRQNVVYDISEANSFFIYFTSSPTTFPTTITFNAACL